MKAPKPSEAVHISRNGRRSLCGQSMKGEREMPAGTLPTCPVCVHQAGGR